MATSNMIVTFNKEENMKRESRIVSKEEFLSYLNSYQGTIETHLKAVSDPPVMQYRDYSLSNDYHDSIIATAQDDVYRIYKINKKEPK